MPTFREVMDAMRSQSGEAYSDFETDCYERHALDHEGEEAPAEFAEFWLTVAAGKSDEYDPETGKRLFEV
jgi:hypothetical protein